MLRRGSNLRTEYHNKVISRLFGGPRAGCYALAVTIFSLGIIRDAMYIFNPISNELREAILTKLSYERALRDQPSHPHLIASPLTKPLAGALFVSGNVLVLSSMWALGVTGTYLGDYFGILMDHIVTGFPFNVTNSPMYWGSTMSFLGTALWFGKPAGVLLTFAVYVTYKIALSYEE
jgi:phosphatidylethanolamine N-methyltransferase